MKTVARIFAEVKERADLKRMLLNKLIQKKTYYEELVQQVNEMELKSKALELKHENQMYVETVISTLIAKSMLKSEVKYEECTDSTPIVFELYNIPNEENQFSLFNLFKVKLNLSDNDRTVSIDMPKSFRSLINFEAMAPLISPSSSTDSMTSPEFGSGLDSVLEQLFTFV